MKRIERMFTLVDVLRGESHRPLPISLLAKRLEVGERTVERDVAALRASGLPIVAVAEGYRLDHARTPPPVGFTHEEAVAVAAALQGLPASPYGVSPFADAAGSALGRLAAVLAAPEELPDGSEMPPVLADALAARRVLRIGYVDQAGAATEREVEPLGYVISKGHWLLVAWCRARDALRPFRADRITSVEVTGEVPEPRRLRREDLTVPYGELMQLTPG
jgi:predicted DNA-binding transcriptional regulator YafY